MKVLIVEDNRSAINVIRSFLEEFPEPLDICDIANTVEEAIEKSSIHQPDIYILDIRLQDELIFPLFEQLGRDHFKNAEIIFTTAYYEADYLYKALQHSVLEYIVKPVEKEKLFSVLHQAIDKLKSPDLESRMQKLEAHMQYLKNQTHDVERLPFKCMNGTIEYIEIDRWVHIYTEESITRVQFIDGSVKATPLPLKHFEKVLDENGPFFRISKQQIIHLRYLEKFHPRENTVTLTNGITAPVARRRVTSLLEKIEREN